MKILAHSMNGELVQQSELIETYLDRSRTDLSGAYESLRTYQGRLFRLDQHLDRLEHSAELLEFSLPVPRAQIQDWVQQLVEGVHQEADEGVEQFVLLMVNDEDVMIISRLLEIDRSMYENGYRLLSVSVDRPKPEAKSLAARPHSHRANRQAIDAGYDEALLISSDGECTEAAYASLFWVKDGKVFTNTSHALPGITQQAVIDAIEGDYEVSADILKKENIKTVDEMFLTVTSRGVIPVVSVDDVIIGDGKPGEATKKIMQLFNNLADHA